MTPQFIEKFLPDQLLQVCYSYSLIKFSNHAVDNIDGQTNSLIGAYSDGLMETILDLSTPVKNFLRKKMVLIGRKLKKQT